MINNPSTGPDERGSSLAPGAGASCPPGGFVPGPDWETLHTDALYSAHAQDLEFLWRWVIVRNGEIVQEGCSLSLHSAKRSVGHVLAFYAASVNRQPSTATDGLIKESC